MVHITLSKVGKTRIIFFDPDAKVYSDHHRILVIGEGLFPGITTRCGRYKWTLQQDTAPSHTARNSIANGTCDSTETAVKPKPAVWYLLRENIALLSRTVHMAATTLCK